MPLRGVPDVVSAVCCQMGESLLCGGAVGGKRSLSLVARGIRGEITVSWGGVKGEIRRNGIGKKDVKSCV